MSAAKQKVQDQESRVLMVSNINSERFRKERVSAEAACRASFVRGTGSSLAGYCDGYADGFEHAIQWLRDQTNDPLTVDYRNGAGMSFAKEHYKRHPKDRIKILEWFTKIVTSLSQSDRT